MFANFEKAFYKKNEMDKQVPEEVLRSLSEKLPEGFVYTNVGDGAVGITPLDSEVEIQGLSIEIPEDLNGSFKPSTINELTEFIYRTQHRIKVKPMENNCITLNGTSFKIDEIVEFPLIEKKLGELELYMVPPPFQPPFEISLEGNGIVKTFLIQRQPYADMHKSLFKSIDSKAFEISYIIDEIGRGLQFNFKLNIESAGSIEEVIEVLKLYQSCKKGEIKVNGEILPASSAMESEDTSIFEIIKFWEKVLILQKDLNVKFTPVFQIDREDMIVIEELYKSFIEKKPFKEYVNFNDITLKGYQGLEVNNLLEADGLSFQFIQTSQVEILGVELNLHSIVSYFDFKVEDVKSANEDKSKLVLFVKPLDGRKIYQSTLHFSSSEEASNYITNISDISELQNAEPITI